MASLVAGIDFSSKAIHVALLPLDPDDGGDAPPVTLRSYEFPAFKTGTTTPAFRSVERCRLVRDAMRELLGVVNWHDGGDELYGWHWVEVAHVCVETPFGASRKADNVMRELYGAILASIPPHIERDTITVHEWRSIVFPDGPLPGGWKATAIDRAAAKMWPVDVNEHEAEALLIARACRERLHQAVAT